MIDLDIKEQIESHSVISFDIFDTLLLRPYMASGDLFRHIEENKSIKGFAKARVNAEKTAREKSSKEEVTLEEIYNQIEPKFSSIKNDELYYEEKLLQINPKAKEIFDYAKEKHKKVIIISDMYLSKSFLSNVLELRGYNNIDKIYVSSEFGFSKNTGHLFGIVKNDLDIDSNEILHIGDNKHSDYEKAIASGFGAYLLKSPRDLFFEKDERVSEFYKNHRKNLNISIILSIVSYIYSLDEKNYWKILGYKYAGPAIFAYMKWLTNQLKTDKIKNVLFVARDGYTLQKVFDLYNQKNDFVTSYVYASRVFDILFNLNYKQKIKEDPDIEGMSAITNIINSYRYEHPILQKETPEEFEYCEAGDRFIQKHISIYSELAEKKKQSYREYIQPFIHCDKIAVVDTSSIYLSSQKFLSQFCSELGTQVYGYYWLNPTKKKLGNEKYHFKTFQKSHKWEFSNWGVMEFFMTAPEPPIKDFQNGSIVYKELSSMEKQRINVYPDISQGAILFSKIIMHFFNDVPFSINAEDITLWINNFCKIPTETDKEMLGDIKTGIDSNHSKYIPLFEIWYQKPEERTPINFLQWKIGYIKKKKGNITYKILGIPVWKTKEKTVSGQDR